MTEPAPPPDPSNTPVEELVAPLDPDDDVNDLLESVDLDEPPPDDEQP